ncbi:hypothetical protein ABFS83_10G079200 [Erythranthe nasuta]
MADDLDDEYLEDGEQWLPSDFFSIDEIQTSTRFSYSSSSSPNPSRTAEEEESYQSFSASTSLQSHPNYRHLCKPFPNLQRINPAVSYGTVGVSGGGDPCECKTGNIRTGCSPGYRFEPVQTQIERFIGERAMAILHHQRQQRTRFSMNRVFSVVGMGPGHVGTGVFLPRTALLTKNSNIHHNLRKGPRTMNSREYHYQLPPRKILLNRRQEEWPGTDTGTRTLRNGERIRGNSVLEK